MIAEYIERGIGRACGMCSLGLVCECWSLGTRLLLCKSRSDTMIRHEEASSARLRKGVAAKAASERNTGEGTSRKKIEKNGSPTKCRCLFIVVGSVALALFFVWIIPSPVDPIAFRYSDQELPEFVGALAVNSHLKKARRLFENEILGPESFAVDKQGQIYTGLGDGRIIRISPDLQSYTTVLRTGHASHGACGSNKMEQECGRVLGMEFNPLNPSELYAVDCSLGLLKINVETKEIKNLLPTTQNNEENTIFCNFVNDLTVLENGSVFFTDSSKKFKRSKNKLEFAESRPNGGLFQYNPHSNLISFVADGLYFPNGICVNHDRDSILFAESTRARIMRYHLSGAKAGTVDVFVDNLPGIPDNISPSASGGYWVAFALVRSSMLDSLTTLPSIRNLIVKLGLAPIFEMTLPHHAMVVELDSAGEVVRSLHDRGGQVTSSVSHVLDQTDRLLMGSYHAPYLVLLNVSDLPHQ